MFLNKLDRPGASFSSSLQSLLSNRLHPKPMPLALPIASFDPQDYARAEPGVEGLVDLVNWEVWRWDGAEVPTRHQLPRSLEELSKLPYLAPSHPIIPHLIPARTALLETLSLFSEHLMEKLLDLPSDPSAYLSVSSSDIMPELRAATLRNDILPVLCGSAFKHIGTELVMNYIGELLPSPVDVAAKVPSPKEPLRMLAWKVGWDKRKGWMTFVRVYSGRCPSGIKIQYCLFESGTRQERFVVSLQSSIQREINVKGSQRFFCYMRQRQKRSIRCHLVQSVSF